MRESLLAKLVCPGCGEGSLMLQEARRNDLEVTDAVLACPGCAKRYTIAGGIVDLLGPATGTVASEIAGWRKYHTPQRNPEQFSDRWLLQLPRIDGSVSNDRRSIEAWNNHADNFDLALAQLGLKGGEEILELGAGRCWASAAFAKRGCPVVALDVVRDKYIGLESAAVVIGKQLYFERVLANMEKLPFADGCFDVVFATATVHHAPDLERLFSEASRVLRRGGRFVVINDTVAGWLDAAQDLEEMELGINEHAYSVRRYKCAMRKAGLRPRLSIPEPWRKQLSSGSRDLRNPIKRIAFGASSALWKIDAVRGVMEYFLANWAQSVWGIGLHAVAFKRDER